MPTLTWIGKDKVVNHHHDVPYFVLEKTQTFRTGQDRTGQDRNCTTNRIVHGDNLLVLKSLLPEFEGRVNCIYIDPPYNTGNEGWVYNDNVNDPRIKKWLGDVVGKEGEDLTRHDKWLCMMYPRLKLLHQLLAEDGVIFISIDDNEQANLKLICDEIFGAINLVSNVIWQKKYTVSNDAKWLSDNHDHILLYAKNKDIWRPNRLTRTEEMDARYRNPDGHPKGVWKSTPLYAKRKGSIKEQAFSYQFKNGVVWTPPQGASPRFPADKLKDMDENDEIWFGADGKASPSRKTFLIDLKDALPPAPTVWLYSDVGSNHEARDEIKALFSHIQEDFDTPKPTRLIERVLQIATNKNSIILDSFAGSGTTAHAVLKLNAQDGGNRQFILCEMMDYADTITAERVRRVMTGYGEGNKKVAGLGGAFDYYTLGEPLFNGDYLNESVGTAKIRQYVAYSENIPLVQRCENSPVSPYLLGLNTDTSWIFYYEPERETVLDAEFLGTLKYRANGFTVPAHSIIYADTCVLTKTQLERFGLRFKKIPRDITRL